MERPRRIGMIAAFAAALMLVPRTAAAHVGGVAAGFLSGFGHPLSGWDHILAMIAVGLWGAQLGPPALWLLPVAFPMMMAVGGFLGLLGVPLPFVELGIALSAVVLGGLVAMQLRLKLSVALAIVAVFALFHGYAHGAELTPGTSALAYSLGFVVSTGCLHGVGIALGLLRAQPIGEVAVRGAGLLVAVAGVWFLVRAG
jgi:urease accessory protein